MKKNKGITLIALVITIIVLLILAGVAISMLSGENGILRKAAEAKTKTDSSQMEEEIALKDMELAMKFSTNNSRYKIKNGYITGVEFEKVGNSNKQEIKSTIEDLKSNLPEGYYVVPKGREDAKEEDLTEDEKKGKLTTGTAVKKENEIIYRVVVFGDIDGDGIIEPADASATLQYIEGVDRKFEDYQIAAMNIYNDEYIGSEDAIVILEVLARGRNMNNFQCVEAKSPNKLIVKTEKEAMEKYVANLTPKDELYKWEWQEKKGRFRITGDMTEEITGDSIIESLGLTGKASVIRTTVDEDEGDEKEEITTKPIQNGDDIILKENEVVYGYRIGGSDRWLATIYKKSN